MTLRCRRDISALVFAAWLCAGAQSSARAQKTPPSNWSTPDAPCAKYDDLRNPAIGDIGVKIELTGDWAAGFRRAVGFWNLVLEANFHEVTSLRACGIRIIYGGPGTVNPVQVARSQITGWENFRGKIAVRPIAPGELSSAEIYAIAVHEIGHMLGLQHNPSAGSVMYFLNVDGTEMLDARDILNLGRHHKLRGEVTARGYVPLAAPGVAPAATPSS